MAKLDLVPDRDFNFIFAGGERMFLERSYTELDFQQFFFRKLSEESNGSKRMIITFSSDGKNRSISYIGSRGDLERLSNTVSIKALETAKANLAKAKEETTVDGYRLMEEDEDNSDYIAGGSSGGGTEVPDTSPATCAGSDEIIFRPSILANLFCHTAVDYLVKIMNAHQEAAILIDSEILTSTVAPADINWLIYLFDAVRKRRWSADNRRASVFILFERDKCPEDFIYRVSGSNTIGYVFENIPELRDIPSLSLNILMPNENDLRNLVFKRVVQYSPKDFCNIEAYTDLLCQAVSESCATGCQTITVADNAVRTLLGSCDHSPDNLKRILSLESVKRKKRWEDLKGESARRVHDDFIKMKEKFTPKQEEKAVDPTFCYRTDKEERNRPPGIPHFILIGEPGTGKTTMASIMAREFFEMGILKSDRPVIVNLGERIASPNHSWVHNLFEIEGRDRLVFIDEVESAVKSATGGWGEENAGGGDSHLSSSLQIFVTKLLSVTTDNDCDTIVCLAGYKRGVDRLLRLDSGLSSRFPTTFTLKGYDGSVLKEILKAYLNKNYQQIVDIDAENMLPALIDDLRASLKHEDMEGWANGRTAETIAEKVHSLKPDKTVLTMDDFAEVTIQIGSNEYKLRNYIGLSGGNPLDDLRRIAGTEKIVEYLEKLQKRYESKVKLPTRMNIAILSAGATYDIDRVLMPIARFLARINAITRPSVTHFDYGATLSFYQNRPTMLTEQQFDMAEGSLLVFDQPSRYFDNIEKNRYTEQTTAIQSRASLISNTDSDTVMVVLETVEGWDEMEDPSRFPDFTSLFTPFEFSVKDRSGAIQILELRLRDMNFELSPEFIAELSADHDIISPDLIDPTVDLLLDNASLKMNEKGDKMVLTADEAHFFFGGGLW